MLSAGRGRPGRGVLGSRTVPALIGNIVDAQITSLLLENEEALLHDTSAQVEEILNSRRDRAGLPSHLLNIPLDAFEEVCRLERVNAEALAQERLHGTAEMRIVSEELKEIKRAIADIPGAIGGGTDNTKGISDSVDAAVKKIAAVEALVRDAHYHTEEKLASQMATIQEEILAAQKTVAEELAAEQKMAQEELAAAQKMASQIATVQEEILAAQKTVAEELAAAQKMTADELVSAQKMTADELVSAQKMAQKELVSAQKMAQKELVSAQKMVAEVAAKDRLAISEKLLGYQQATTIKLDEQFSQVATADKLDVITDIISRVAMAENLRELAATIQQFATSQSVGELASTMQQLATAEGVNELMVAVQQNATAEKIGELNYPTLHLAATTATADGISSLAQFAHKHTAWIQLVSKELSDFAATAATADSISGLAATLTTVATADGLQLASIGISDLSAIVATAESIQGVSKGISDLAVTMATLSTSDSLDKIRRDQTAAIQETSKEFSDLATTIADSFDEFSHEQAKGISNLTATVATLATAASIAEVVKEQTAGVRAVSKGMSDLVATVSHTIISKIEALKGYVKEQEISHLNDVIRQLRLEKGEITRDHLAVVEATGKMKGRFEVEREMAVAAAKVEIYDTLTLRFAEEKAAAVAETICRERDLTKARERDLIAAKEKAEGDAQELQNGIVAAAAQAADNTKRHDEEITKLKAHLYELQQKILQLEAEPRHTEHASRHTEQASSSHRGIEFNLPLPRRAGMALGDQAPFPDAPFSDARLRETSRRRGRPRG
ncbi:hypothetical protein V493_01109 [Pseudogymnoascus sp. VKM F-4281 (FW-2241)]|nr:hypothetical protein V493_01109 [Pseudogymnoascus sp. VKM F-4281 (FW-2241)]